MPGCPVERVQVGGSTGRDPGPLEIREHRDDQRPAEPQPEPVDERGLDNRGGCLALRLQLRAQQRRLVVLAHRVTDLALQRDVPPPGHAVHELPALAEGASAKPEIGDGFKGVKPRPGRDAPLIGRRIVPLDQVP